MAEQSSDVPSHSSPSFFNNASGVMASNSTFQIITTSIVNNLPNSDPSAPPRPLDSGGRESYPLMEPDFSVYGDRLYPRSRWFRILSALCFFAPDRHLDNLIKLCAGNVLDKATWKDTIRKLLDEWVVVVTSSAGLLSCNITIAFLSEGTASTNANYSSTSICVCVIALGLILIIDHRDMIQAPSGYLRNTLREHMEHRTVNRIEPLALIFGLPYGLLIWSLLLSLLSFMMIVWDTVDNRTKAFILILMIVTGLILSWLTCLRRLTSRSIEHPV